MSILDESVRSNIQNIKKLLAAIERETPSMSHLAADRSRATGYNPREVLKKIFPDYETTLSKNSKDVSNMPTKQASKAYFNGYMFKNAGWGEALGGILDKATGSALALGQNTALLAPAAAGLLGGAAVSKLTSPSGEATVAQKALIAAELEEAVAEMKRQRKIETIKEVMRDGQGYKGRSLHI